MEGLISSEQVLFADSVRRFAVQEYGMGPVPHRLRFDRARLMRLAEIGCLSLAIPEDLGGLGGPVEAMVALEALAPALPPEPVLASGIHAAALIAAAASEALAAEILPLIAEGSRIAVVAELEAEGRYDRRPRSTLARPEAGGFRLDGAKPLVAFGAEADYLVVSASMIGETALFLLPADAPGLTRTPYATLDGIPAADIRLEGCLLPAGARLDRVRADAALAHAADVATAAQVAEMVGLMAAMIDATTEYARTRRQFGVPIGTFQALQHRIADMWIACEETRSLAAAAALACGEDVETRTRAVSSAMLLAIDAAHRVGSETIQIHGGIGMTDELMVSHWYRRLWALRQRLGDRNFHLQRLVALAPAA